MSKKRVQQELNRNCSLKKPVFQWLAIIHCSAPCFLSFVAASHMSIACPKIQRTLFLAKYALILILYGSTISHLSFCLNLIQHFFMSVVIVLQNVAPLVAKPRQNECASKSTYLISVGTMVVA